MTGNRNRWFRLEGTAVFGISCAGRTLRRYLQPARDRYGLYDTRDLVTMEIGRRGDRTTAAELCRALWLTPNSLSSVLARSIEAGYVDARPNPDDGRSRTLELTAVGRISAELMADAWAAGERHVRRALGPADHADLVRLLGRATTALDAVRRTERPLYFPTTRPSP